MTLSLSSDSLQPKIKGAVHVGDLRFEEVGYAAGLQLPRHAHANAYLDLCVKGIMQDTWQKKTLKRGPATLNYLPIGAPHASSFQEEAHAFQIVLPRSWLDRLQPPVGLPTTPIHYFNGLPIWIATRLYREYQSRDSLTPLVLEGLLLELMAAMARHAGKRADDGSRWLQQVQDFLHAHFAENLSVEAIAAAVGVHPAHLMRGFRKRHGCTLGEYIRKVRIDCACHLLSATEDSLAEIAVSVGFADQSHFSRTFKRYTGSTPAAFRKISGPRAIPRQ